MVMWGCEMDIEFQPLMWEDLEARAGAFCAEMSKVSLRGPAADYAAQACTARMARNNESFLLAAHLLTHESQCTPLMAARLAAESSLILAQEGDIVAARTLAARATRSALHSLGALHSATLDLRRWELHWMTFTLMHGIAQRRYARLVRDAGTLWGQASPEYWKIRLEALIPLWIVGNRRSLKGALDALYAQAAQALPADHHLLGQIATLHARIFDHADVA